MTAEKKHALLSPSKAARWTKCPGSVALELKLPKPKSNAAADAGTAAHELAELCLTIDGAIPAGYIGRVMENGVAVDEEMALEVGKYVDHVRAMVEATGGHLLVEQALPIDFLTGEAGAAGTADAVILAGEELIVVDLKYGKGHVVESEDNEQLLIYALAALEQFGLLSDFQTVRVCIFQPRRDHYPENVYSVADLAEMAEDIKDTAATVWAEIAKSDSGCTADQLVLAPGEAQCRWCPAKAKCPALEAVVTGTTEIDFEPVEFESDNCAELLLSARRKMVPLVRAWCDAIEDEVEKELKAGKDIPGWKLVAGKKGARAWADPEAAETAMKAMKVKHDAMYKYTLISPAGAEKLAEAGEIGPRQWPKLEALITQSNGKPTVVPASDKRPAIAIDPVEFEEIKE